MKFTAAVSALFLASSSAFSPAGQAVRVSYIQRFNQQMVISGLCTKHCQSGRAAIGRNQDGYPFQNSAVLAVENEESPFLQCYLCPLHFCATHGLPPRILVQVKFNWLLPCRYILRSLFLPVLTTFLFVFLLCSFPPVSMART